MAAQGRNFDCFLIVLLSNSAGPFKKFPKEDWKSFLCSKVTIRRPNSSVCLSSLHQRINTSHPEANPVMEISDDTAASFKMEDFNQDFLT